MAPTPLTTRSLQLLASGLPEVLIITYFYNPVLLSGINNRVLRVNLRTMRCLGLPKSGLSKPIQKAIYIYIIHRPFTRTKPNAI